MNSKEYDAILAELSALAERAREADRVVSLLSGEIDACRRRMANMKGRSDI